MTSIMHKWAEPHFDDFKILGVFGSPNHRLYLTKSQVPGPITLFGTSQSLFAHAALIDDFQGAQMV